MMRVLFFLLFSIRIYILFSRSYFRFVRRTIYICLLTCLCLVLPLIDESSFVVRVIKVKRSSRTCVLKLDSFRVFFSLLFIDE